MASPQKVVTSSLWEVISLPFCLLRQTWIWTRVLTSLTSGASLLSLVSAPQQVPLCIWGLHPDSPGGQIPLWIKLSVGIWWDLLLVVWGMYLGDKRGDKSLSPQSWQWTPMKCWGNLKVRYGHWGRLAGSNISLCWHRLNRLVSKGWAPRTKRSPLIYLCKQVTEAKSKAQFTYGCMWLYWLFYSPSVMWPSLCLSSLSFISALPSLPFTSLSEHSLCVSLLALLPATLVWTGVG
jgi:hypothetical protein